MGGGSYVCRPTFAEGTVRVTTPPSYDAQPSRSPTEGPARPGTPRDGGRHDAELVAALRDATSTSSRPST